MVLVYKQVIAVVDGRTTVVCLDMNGIIVPVDKPFETLAGDFQSPPFHIHCRSLVAPHVQGAIRELRAQANAELQKRPLKERRTADGKTAATIPGPTQKNPPSGFSRASDHVNDPEFDKVLFDLQKKTGTPKKAADPWSHGTGRKKIVATAGELAGREVVLARWHRSWILPAVLEKLRAASLRLDPADRADVLGALIDALAGLQVTDLAQIPERIRRLLGL